MILQGEELLTGQSRKRRSAEGAETQNKRVVGFLGFSDSWGVWVDEGFCDSAIKRNL